MSSIVTENVEAGATLYTDALHSYDRMAARGYIHSVIDHAEAYADGQVHTNGLENFWSLLKRALKGTYVSVEPFHLFRYLDEQAFRFNNRKGSDAMRFALALKGILNQAPHLHCAHRLGVAANVLKKASRQLSHTATHARV